MRLVLIGIGGAIGAMSRYVVSGLDFKYSYGALPIGTLVVNLSGSLIIGFLWGLFEAVNVSSNIRMFVFIGILGGFTTFSSFALENFNLLRDGERNAVIFNIALSNLLGIFLVYVGYVFAKMITGFLKG
jgi:fluoride exporter